MGNTNLLITMGILKTNTLTIMFLFVSSAFIAQTTTNEGVDSGTQGNNNSFFGYQAGQNTTSNDNTFLGYNAGQSNTTGKDNLFIGSIAGEKNTTGNYNAFFGRRAGSKNTTGSYNLFLGASAGGNTNTGSHNFFLGYYAGNSNTTGVNNIYVGSLSGRYNATGQKNIFIGGSAGANSQGNHSVFIGYEAGNKTTIGGNTFVGTYAGKNNTTGNGNVFSGYNSGVNNVSGDNNVYLGFESGLENLSGSSNVYIGNESGRDNENGANNVFIGDGAGISNYGSNNILIGNDAGGSSGAVNNKLYIQNDDADIPLLYGDFATDQLGINTNTIPNGDTFAVGGSASVDGDLKSSRLEVEAPDNANNWIAMNIGRKLNDYSRNFNFAVSPSNNANELLGFTISDKNNIARQDNYFRDDFSRISYKSNRNQYFFTLDHNDREGQDRAAIQMPLANSKVVIGGYGDYLEDQGHKLIVQNGTALIEDAIYTNGRIAIGTTEPDPGYALTVKGYVHVQEVKVDLLGVIAPDYVFKEDYQLRTLAQVEDYIDQEGHLPNIPSASEMEKEGVNLKEMNMKLLEKVEELTLYTIAQEKAIKEQEKRLQKLEKLLQK